jgi:thiol-disulfide isomerase/thioredoxin
VDLLDETGDAHNLEKAVGYVTRVMDQVEKTGVENKPERVSEQEWKDTHQRVKMSLYLIRGRLQEDRHDYAAATSDLETSYRLIANPAAAMRLGEVAELRKDYKKAIDEYSIAFVLPDQEESSVDRREVRRKLGNLWQIVNGTGTGLGERILLEYDRVNTGAAPGSAAEPNKGATDPYLFVLRPAKGEAPVHLGEWKGKVLVLSFWATWCGPCREMDPLLDQIRHKYDGNAAIGFLAVSTDEDESRVPSYLAREKFRTTVVYSDGLANLMQVHALPTVIVLNRTGQIVYRAQGFDEDSFAASLTTAIERALASTSAN